MMFQALLAALAVSTSSPAAGRLERELKGWIQAHIGREGSGDVQFTPALIDLNGDNAPEALVRISGRYWCGSGGCPLYILQRRAGTWRLLNSVTITNPPIRVLAAKSRGWNNIGVQVQGGGMGPAYEAVLRFNGVRYPGNPTVAPAFRSRPGTAGRAVISRDSQTKPLFP